MTSHIVIHQDDWYQPNQLFAVFKQQHMWLRLKSTALMARLLKNHMCLVFALVIKTLMVSFFSSCDLCVTVI